MPHSRLEAGKALPSDQQRRLQRSAVTEASASTTVRRRQAQRRMPHHRRPEARRLSRGSLPLHFAPMPCINISVAAQAILERRSSHQASAPPCRYGHLSKRSVTGKVAVKHARCSCRDRAVVRQVLRPTGVIDALGKAFALCIARPRPAAYQSQAAPRLRITIPLLLKAFVAHDSYSRSTSLLLCIALSIECRMETAALAMSVKPFADVLKDRLCMRSLDPKH
jgi:hypothetical protein